MRRAPPYLTCLAALLTAGCPFVARDLSPSNVCPVAFVEQETRVAKPRNIDLLLVIDDSGSMEEEQRALRVQIPRLIRALTLGDRDGDGAPDFVPAASLQVGIVTTDMGTGRFVSDSCPGGAGGDGLLVQTAGVVPGLTCASAYPPFLRFPEDPDAPRDPGAVQLFTRDVQCLSARGTAGCSFEQPLEAVLKAVTPSTAGPIFVGDTFGHGDGANAGFVRDDATLVVVVLTDEDDCSTPDPALFDPEGTVYPGPFADGASEIPLLDRRCSAYRDAQHAVERYTAGLSALNNQGVVFAVIGGLPEEAVDTWQRDRDWDRLLADAGMAERPDPDSIATLQPACERELNALTQRASPARRLVEVAQRIDELGAQSGGQLDLTGLGQVHSICEADANGEADFSAVIDGILFRIAEALGGGCLPEPLRRGADGRVQCFIDETPPLGTSCAELPGRTLVGTTADGSERCAIAQLPVTDVERASGDDPEGAGFFYDDYSNALVTRCPAERPRVLAFTDAIQLTEGARIRVECRVDDLRTSSGRVDVRTSCDQDPDVCDLDVAGLASLREQYARDDATLFCEPVERVCRIPCETDAACPAGQACDDRGTTPFCVDPTCE